MRSLFIAVTAVVLCMCCESWAEETAPTNDELRAAVAKALPLLEKGAAGHREQRTCFACHSQGIPILAMTTARERGFAIGEEELGKQLQYIADFLGRNRESYLQGKGQGGQVDTAGYALMSLELGGWKPDETTAAVSEYLLLYRKDEDHWRANSQRPPTEASPFTTTYVGLRGLQTFGTPEQKDRIAARRQQVRGWLLKTPATDNEDRVFRLLALKAVAAPEEDLKAAARELKQAQHADGGWSQLDVKAAAEGDASKQSSEEAEGDKPDFTHSDAYATGTALVALHHAGGLSTSDPAYQRGLRFLLKTQLPDGSWLVQSRSKPFQKYFETGFPHGKNQFISSAASGWAVTAIALGCEK